MAEDTGVTPSALANMPELQNHLVYAWTLFSELTKERPHGQNGPLHIPLRAFLDYALVYQFTRWEVQHYWKTVRTIDELWITEFYKRQEAETKKTQTHNKLRGKKP